MSHPVKQLFDLPSLYRFRASPSEDRVAFVRDSSGRSELSVLDTRTAAVTRISDGELGSGDPGPIIWAPNGHRIYFQRVPEPGAIHTIETIDMDGTVETVLEADDRIHLEDMSPDGRFLLYMYHGAYEGPYHRDLYRYDRETGTSERITEHDLPVHRVAYSPEGDRIAYSVYDMTDGQEECTAYVARSDGSRLRELEIGESGSVSRAVDWHPDGRRLLVTDDASGVSRPGVYSLDSDEVTRFETAGCEVQSMAFLPGGDGFLAGHYREVTTIPAIYTLDGQSRQLDLDGGVAGYPSWVAPYDDIFLADGDVVLARSTETRPSELIRYDIDADEAEVLIGAADTELDPGSLVDAEYVTYESTDGLEIGALLYRATADPSPAIVHVHGGPETRAARQFDPYGQYAQFFVRRGYTVLQPNYRGSTGRGSEFRRLLHGDWGGGDAADVAAGCRWLQSRSWIDEDRVGVFGQSYGAYGTFVQMTKYPELWTAGIAWNGPPEWRGGEESYGPLENVERVERPLLVLAGENDPSLEGMRRFRDRLADRGRTAGEDFEYEELADEGHHSRETDHQIRRFRIVAEFLERRL